MAVTANDFKTLPRMFNAAQVQAYMLQNKLYQLLAFFSGSKKYPVSAGIEWLTNSTFSHMGIVRRPTQAAGGLRNTVGSQVELCESVTGAGVRCRPFDDVFNGYMKPGDGPYDGRGLLAIHPGLPQTPATSAAINTVIGDELQQGAQYSIKRDVQILLREAYYDIFCRQSHPDCNKNWAALAIDPLHLICSELVEYVYRKAANLSLAAGTICKAYTPGSIAEMPAIQGIFALNLTNNVMMRQAASTLTIGANKLLQIAASPGLDLAETLCFQPNQNSTNAVCMPASNPAAEPLLAASSIGNGDVSPINFMTAAIAGSVTLAVVAVVAMLSWYRPQKPQSTSAECEPALSSVDKTTLLASH